MPILNTLMTIQFHEKTKLSYTNNDHDYNNKNQHDRDRIPCTVTFMQNMKIIRYTGETPMTPWMF